MTIKRVLVPIDFSPASLRGLDYAIAFAKRAKAALDVLFVVEPTPLLVFADLDGRSVNLQRLLTEQRNAGEQQLARLAARLAKRRVRFRACVEVGPPPAMIVDEAIKRHADLIIMATHGRTGLSHMVLGSVAERVVRTAPCPVLTVRPQATAKRRHPSKAAPSSSPSRNLRL